MTVDINRPSRHEHSNSGSKKHDSRRIMGLPVSAAIWRFIPEVHQPVQKVHFVANSAKKHKAGNESDLVILLIH
jgi:hypothetical protein